MMTVKWTLSGREIDNRDTVAIHWQEDNLAEIVPDGSGAPAVVVDWETCFAHEDCRVLTVAPDDTDTLEYVHASDTAHYLVTRQLGK